jgi:mRNA interferase MazF
LVIDRKKSQVMIDKTQTAARDKIGSTIGRLHSDTLVEVDRALATFPGIG